jgi:hypothetical protein
VDGSIWPNAPISLFYFRKSIPKTNVFQKMLSYCVTITATMVKFSIICGIVLFLHACGVKEECKIPIGHWTDNEGREMVFQPDGKALWLTRFGSQYDTQTCAYKVDCTTVPATMEMKGFSSGPYTGRTVYGIFEWSSDTSVRCQFNEGEHPKIFDSQQSMKLSRQR